MIEIFKTNVIKKRAAKSIVTELMEILPNAFVNFDLDDCDRILRVQTADKNFEKRVIKVVNKMGFHCEILNDK